MRTHTNAEMTYHGGRFRLEPGEALVVTVHEPDKPFLYWGLTLTSPWMESFDYRYTTTALNNETAARSPDGSWRMVIAPSDPGGGELARHGRPARGLHAGALGPGRGPAAPDGRGRADRVTADGPLRPPRARRSAPGTGRPGHGGWRGPAPCRRRSSRGRRHGRRGGPRGTPRARRGTSAVTGSPHEA